MNNIQECSLLLARSTTECYTNTIFIEQSKITTVKIGIPNYNKDEDKLSVVMNNKLLKLNKDYTISEDSTEIIAVEGISWNNTALLPQMVLPDTAPQPPRLTSRQVQ